MKIAICDDIVSERELIKACLQNNASNIIENSEIDLYTPSDLDAMVSTKQMDFDIVILDIQFENTDFDGIALAKKINTIRQECKIIYLTHLLEFAPMVYETEHCYFVMKDNMDSMLPQAITKAISLLKHAAATQSIEISANGSHSYIKQSDILYIEKLDRKTYIHTKNETYETYISLSSILRKLNRDMVRCHSSFIVNIACISRLNRETLILSNNTEIPIGKTFREQMKSAYLKYWTLRG